MLPAQHVPLPLLSPIMPFFFHSSYAAPSTPPPTTKMALIIPLVLVWPLLQVLSEGYRLTRSRYTYSLDPPSTTPAYMLTVS